jgi:hypothetical protein
MPRMSTAISRPKGPYHARFAQASLSVRHVLPRLLPALYNSPRIAASSRPPDGKVPRPQTAVTGQHFSPSTVNHHGHNASFEIPRRLRIQRSALLGELPLEERVRRDASCLLVDGAAGTTTICTILPARHQYTQALRQCDIH